MSFTTFEFRPDVLWFGFSAEIDPEIELAFGSSDRLELDGLTML
jgi:hypothetical protein